MSSIRKVNAIKLWNDVIVDLNSISGFTSPFIRRSDNYFRCPSEMYFYMEFVIHTHPSKIVVSEKVISANIPLIQNTSDSLYRYVMATKDNSYGIDESPDFTKIKWGWLQVDGFYTIEPNDKMICFQEFLSKFNELVKVWNNDKEIQCLTNGVADTLVGVQQG